MSYLTLTTRLALRRRDNGRKGHLNTSFLIDRVNTGSSKRVSLRHSVWRQSRHISQTPGVMSGIAIKRWTGMSETGRATDWGISAARVKGGASARTSIFMTAVR